jgi:hypothetical protein
LQQREPSDATTDMLMPEIAKLFSAHVPGETYDYSNIGLFHMGAWSWHPTRFTNWASALASLSGMCKAMSAIGTSLDQNDDDGLGTVGLVCLPPIEEARDPVVSGVRFRSKNILSSGGGLRSSYCGCIGCLNLRSCRCSDLISVAQTGVKGP